MFEHIANMPGPEFIILYLWVIGGAIVGSQLLRLLILGPASEESALISREDPVELAYLRSGPAAALELITLKLVSLGYLEESSPAGTYRKVEAGPSPRYLQPLERDVLGAFSMPLDLRKMLALPNLRDHPAFARFQRAFEERGMLNNPTTRRLLWLVFWLGLAVIIGLGGFKLLVAMSRGKRKIGFLLVSLVFGPLIFGLLNGSNRYAKKGKKYLRDLEVAYAQIRERLTGNTGEMDQDPAFLLAVALFGTVLVKGSRFQGLHDTFHPQPSSSTTSCSSSSCSSSSCGSSCGGGCGGCGS